MHKIDDEMRKMYVDNPVLLETKRIALYDYLEEKVKEYNLDHLMHPAFKKLEKMWGVAVSFWIFPDLADVDKILDELYIKHRDKNL